ncbi:hypothetical protein [Pseudonocardia dioxanivorans]|uniref:hypothetical protein n=1 Tax=Pseudonocardia dioxanivorans TaxID=240495 RepID=UPI00131A49BA|nr:hypothetical protein [Pseudonocardia dioxanivorans]
MLPQAVAQFLDRDVDELDELLDRAAELLELVQHGRLPVLDPAQLDLGALFDLRALPVQLGQPPVALDDEIIGGHRGRGELREQVIFSPPTRLLVGVEPIPSGGQPGEMFSGGRPAACPSRTWCGRLDHQGPPKATDDEQDQR